MSLVWIWRGVPCFNISAQQYVGVIRFMASRKWASQVSKKIPFPTGNIFSRQFFFLKLKEKKVTGHNRRKFFTLKQTCCNSLSYLLATLPFPFLFRSFKPMYVFTGDWECSSLVGWNVKLYFCFLHRTGTPKMTTTMRRKKGLSSQLKLSVILVSNEMTKN